MPQMEGAIVFSFWPTALAGAVGGWTFEAGRLEKTCLLVPTCVLVPCACARSCVCVRVQVCAPVRVYCILRVYLSALIVGLCVVDALGGGS
jgi:hypothetical protein